MKLLSTIHLFRKIVPVVAILKLYAQKDESRPPVCIVYIVMYIYISENGVLVGYTRNDAEIAQLCFSHSALCQEADVSSLNQISQMGEAFSGSGLTTGIEAGFSNTVTAILHGLRWPAFCILVVLSNSSSCMLLFLLFNVYPIK